MNRKFVKQWLPRALAVAALAAPGAVAAQQDGSMMGADDMPPCMQQGRMGYGMGPGGGMGMMGGGMMDMMIGGGPGGMGMMGGGGMMGMGPGMGMMGMGPVWMLDLSNEQRDKIEKIHDDARRKNWDTWGKIMDEQAKLRDLYAAETVDPKKAGAVYAGIARLQQQVIESSVEAHNRVQAVLTKEQKEQLRQWRRGGMGGRGGYGPGGMGMGPGMMGR
jgi:Spy/CpxP family protein refolding chaperone